MIFPGVKKIGISLNLERTNNQVIGMVKNTFVRLYDGSNMKVLEMTFPTISEADKESINYILKEHKVKEEKWTDTKITVIFREIFWPYSASKIKKIIEQLSQFALMKYQESNPACEECKTNQLVEAYEIANGSIFLCDSCHKKVDEKLIDEREAYIRIPTNYYFGSLGALLFSFPGIILTAVLFVFLDRIATASSIVYIFLAIKGYSTFKGKIDKIGAVLINLIGILMTFIGVYLSYALMILYKTKSIESTREIIRMPEVIKEIKLNITIALILSFFYVLFNTYDMMKKWKFPELKRAGKIV